MILKNTIVLKICLPIPTTINPRATERPISSYWSKIKSSSNNHCGLNTTLWERTGCVILATDTEADEQVTRYTISIIQILTGETISVRSPGLSSMTLGVGVWRMVVSRRTILTNTSHTTNPYSLYVLQYFTITVHPWQCEYGEIWMRLEMKQD